MYSTRLLNMRYWLKQTQTLDWRQCLLKRLPKENLNRIRRQTHTGRPLAIDSLLSKLEKNSTDASAHTPSADPKQNRINRWLSLYIRPYISDAQITRPGGKWQRYDAISKKRLATILVKQAEQLARTGDEQ